MSFLLRKVEDVTTISKPQSLTSVRIKDCTGGPMRRGADSVRALADSAVGAGKGAATKMRVPIGISDKQDNTKTVSSSHHKKGPREGTHRLFAVYES